MVAANSPGRCIGVDHGSVRVGLAVSDPSRTIASPLPHVSSSNALNEVVAIATQMDAREIIVGLPLNMDGSWSDSTRAARDFASELRDAATAEVIMWDERLSTVEATRALRASGTKRRKRKSRVDSTAASLVLQSYLDSKNSGIDFDFADTNLAQPARHH